ncbi:hypothetical protein [Pseudonocardia sp. H11422]|uniref:hypothetical protein n=1 Tax=Pseudonocardia sp. H11422 TaxID=2835866 RepID=UPI003977E3EE
MIDLSAMKGVHVDPAATVRVQAGATWAEVDRETQLFGLVTPGGEVSRRGREAHAGGRDGRARAGPRAQLRQPAVDRDRHRRRRGPHGEPRRAPRPVLGGPRRRSRPGRRDLVRVRPAPARTRGRDGAGHVPVRASRIGTGGLA